MKSPLFFVASALLVVAPFAQAQDAAPSVDSAPAPISTPNLAGNAWETLVAALKLILPGENGSPSTADKNLSPAENLRRQRAAVARNALALKLLREALQMPISAPAITSNEDVTASFAPNAAAREMARLLRQESDVRLADGDAAGALDSRLTAIELGAAITRGGPLILVGAAVEAIGRQGLEPIVAKTDATSLRAAITRLQGVEARRATFPQVMQAEKATSIRLLALQMAQMALDEKTRQRLATPQGREEMGLGEAEVREMLTLTPATLTTQIATVFDAVIARAQLPYSRALRVVVPAPPSKSAQALTEIWRNPNTRFSYERNVAASRLLEAALEVRAIKLETGTYPATFEAPLDPFAANEPLVYESDGDTYLLYSIGPDGKDNGGAEIQTLEIDTRSDLKTVSERLTPDSTGDILAPIF